MPNEDGLLTPAESSNALLSGVARQIEKPEFTLSNGIVLRTKAVAKEAIRRVFLAVKDPPVPVVMIAAKGREEPNPFDPDYQRARSAANAQRINAITRALHMLGLELVSVPAGIPGPDDESWIEELQAAGVADLHPDNASLRWLEWLEMVALAADIDQAHAFAEAAKTYGLFEREVLDAVKSFRDLAMGGSDHRGGAERDSTNGDQGRGDAPGPAGPRVRGTASGPGRRRRMAGLGDPPAG